MSRLRRSWVARVPRGLIASSSLMRPSVLDRIRGTGDGFCTSSTNERVMRGGGQQSKSMRNTVLTEEYLGSEGATMYRNGMLDDCELRPGRVPHACFKLGDPPPFYDLGAHRTDVPTGKWTCSDKTRRLSDEMRQGYEGQLKGKRQIII